MEILKNDDGDIIVKVPGTFWYLTAGENEYEFGSNVSVYDSKSFSLATEQLVRNAAEYVSCVSRYARDTCGNVVRYGVDIDKEHDATLDMRLGIAVNTPHRTRSVLALSKDDWVPLADTTWHRVTKVRGNGTVELDDGKYRDIEYLVAQMIEYMHNNLPAEETNDAVDHPQHYNHGGRETIDDIKEHLVGSDWNAYEGGLLFNVYKYIDRAPYKGKRKEDLNKAAWYLKKLIDEVAE